MVPGNKNNNRYYKKREEENKTLSPTKELYIKQVKVISNSDVDEFQNSINDFLQTVDPDDILNTYYSYPRDGNTKYSCVIEYRLLYKKYQYSLIFDNGGPIPAHLENILARYITPEIINGNIQSDYIVDYMTGTKGRVYYNAASPNYKFPQYIAYN